MEIEKPPKNEGDLSLSTSAFEALERDFQEVLNELSGDEHLEKFRLEYEKLHRTLMRSHQHEKRLLAKIEELNEEIYANASKIETAIMLSKDDQNTIMELRKEIEKSWNMVSASHEKEAKAKETIQTLTKELSKFSKLAEHGTGLSHGDQETMNELMKEKSDLIAERDSQQTQIVEMNNHIGNLQRQINKLNADKKLLGTTIQEQDKAIVAIRGEHEKEKGNREKADREAKDRQRVLEQKRDEIESFRIQISTQQEHINNLEQAKKKMEKHISEIEVEKGLLFQKNESSEEQLKAILKSKAAIEADRSAIVSEKEIKERALKISKDESHRWKNLFHTAEEKLRTLEDMRRDDLKNFNLKMEQTVNGLEEQLQKVESDLQQQRKEYEKLRADNNYLNRENVKTRKDKMKTDSHLLMADAQKNDLERKLKAYMRVAEELRVENRLLTKERNKYGLDKSEATTKYFQALEEVKIKKLENHDLHKKIAESQEKLKQQQALYEQVRSDRNSKSKALNDAFEELDELKKNLKILSQQVAQQKDEMKAISAKHAEETIRVIKETKEKEKYKDEAMQFKAKAERQEGTINNLKKEIWRNNQIIKESENDRLKLMSDIERVTSERDILGTQLIRRNDEIALLYEKIQIQNSALDKGAVQFREKVEDIRMLKLKINELSRKLHVLSSQISKIKDLKIEKHQLQRQLLLERTKVKALSEELENPMNVHRWRKLEGSDPTAFEMILKTQTLQKRLIQKTQEVMEKDLVIQEKDKLQVELKSILARQPGPELAEQLNVYQEALKKKTVQLKSQASEINMFKHKKKEYDYEQERVVKELDDMKKKYYKEKKSGQVRSREKQREKLSNQDMYPVTHQPHQHHFTGGGFSLNM
jgi:chromosome segregation ATPase